MSGSQAQPMMLHEEIPMVCTIADVCRILRIGRAQYFALRRADRFPLSPLPSFDSTVRYRGSDVQAYLDGELPARPRRRARFGRAAVSHESDSANGAPACNQQSEAKGERTL